MKLPSEIDVYTWEELAESQDFGFGDKFITLDEATELWSHILELREALDDFANHGTRHDLTPTTMSKHCDICGFVDMGPPRTKGYGGYIAEMDEYVRQYAKQVLKKSKERFGE